MKNLHIIIITLIFSVVSIYSVAHASDEIKENSKKTNGYFDQLIPHKALYDINMVAMRSGSKVVNIRGKMFYEWNPSCDAWITNHRFTLYYDYTDSPSTKVASDFTTYETSDGKDFHFSARRKRDDKLYEELRGKATAGLEQGKKGSANFTMPHDLNYELSQDALFPMAHTAEVVRAAMTNQKFFSATVFDGSDDEGPVEINTFIGNPTNAMKFVTPSDALDMTLLNTPAWNVRMAVFPVAQKEASSDYEMSMIFHENGVISDMLIEYDDFSVTQKLVALDRLEDEIACNAPKSDMSSSTKK